MTVMGRLDGGTDVALPFTTVVPSEVLVTGLFDSGDLAASPQRTIYIWIEFVKNPDSMRTSSSIQIETMTKDNELIDKVDTGLAVTPNQPRGIADITMQAEPNVVHQLSAYAF